MMLSAKILLEMLGEEQFSRLVHDYFTQKIKNKIKGPKSLEQIQANNKIINKARQDAEHYADNLTHQIQSLLNDDH